MANILKTPTDMERKVADLLDVSLKNRYYEQNPILNDDGASLLARPGLRKWIEVGTGHIRKLFSEPGVFDDDLFVVSGLYLHRVKGDSTQSQIGIISTDLENSVSMAATAAIGDFAENLYIAEGGTLYIYTENGSARGQLEVSNTISDTETVVIDGVYYAFTNSSVDTGTPDGSSGTPWLVKLDTTVALTLKHLYDAINGGVEGTAGTDYTTGITAHPTVSAVNYSGGATSGDLFVDAITPGADGNTITTTETMANGAWGAATLENGGTESLKQVYMPDDLGAIAVAHINSYVIVIPAQLDGYKGRFYWIEPGETIVRPLNFATAERSPDELENVIVFSDMFWLLGQKTIEAWVTTGDLNAPMQRVTGVVADHGTNEGASVKIRDSFFVIDEHGTVWQQAGSESRRVSTPFVSERIRKNIALNKFRKGDV